MTFVVQSEFQLNKPDSDSIGLLTDRSADVGQQVSPEVSCAL